MEVIASKHVPSQRHFEMAVEVDGTLYCHFMPDDVLETRAAEYQIEPTQIDLLLDIVLYEPYVEDEYGVPLLFRAATVEEARAKHIERVQAIKQRLRPVANAWRSNAERANLLRGKGVEQSWIDAITDDALAAIRLNHRMSVEVMVEKARLVRANVERYQAAQQVRTKPSHEERAAAVRQARLTMMHNELPSPGEPVE